MSFTGRARNASQLPGPAGQLGFTLVELVIVLVVIGLLGAVVAPRFFERREFDAAGFSHQVKALIRYGQKQAIAQNRNVYVRLNGAGVALCYDQNCAARMAPPAGVNSGSVVTLAACGNATNWACEGVPNGLAMTAAPTFFFDPAGRPFNATDGAAALTSTFTAVLTVRVTGDGMNRDTLVEPDTGFTR